ncbi:MAG: TIGR04282 family arsenosugar biosynthesis glycosyltransferase [Candidatus Sumerlaeia bacterium]|nr:TIGR04282 family arsenosugar biosynthesis glycosyltransferase [Candidatus Sumerlaeia bacterium]
MSNKHLRKPSGDNVRSLLFFVRWPEPGVVKTRLAATVGAEEACRIHRFCAVRSFQNARSLSGVNLIVCGTGAPEGHFRDWLPGADEYIAQPAGTLGDRLEHLFGHAHQFSTAGVAAIGSDAPLLGANDIAGVFDVLANHDAAFLPAKDGGYALVATAQFQPMIFRDIPWSSPNTLKATLETCQNLGLTFFIGTPQQDIDTEADWLEVAPQLGGAHHTN